MSAVETDSRVTRTGEYPAATAKPYAVTPVDGAGFTTHRMAALRHNYMSHPLLQLDALRDLAHRLMPKGGCRFALPGMTSMSSAFEHRPRSPDGRDLDQVFSSIETPGSWIALYNIETQPDYQAFVEEVLGGVREAIEREQGKMILMTGYFFISAPPSITPFHIDRENNFWMQIRGRKTMHVWDRDDPEVVRPGDVDRFIVDGSLANVRLRDGMMERAKTFDVGPGDGVYFPSTSPHATRTERTWVTAGDAICISMAVTFCTELTRRIANVHALNDWLRGKGMNPAHPRGSALRDALKYPLGRSLVWARSRFGGYKPSVGME